MSKSTHVRMVSAGTYLPENWVSTAEVEERIAMSSPNFKMRRGLIEAHTGINGRHYMPEEMQASDLAVEAARRALRGANATPKDVDLLIWGSASQDMVEPATSHIVAAKMGMRCPVFDVKNACNSWMNGIQVATALLRSGAYRTALVVTGESPSRAIKWSVENMRDLFMSAAGYTMGDAGAAVFLSVDEKSDGIYFQDFRAASDHWSIATLPGGGSQHPRGDEYSYFSGDGSRLRDAFVDVGPGFIDDALAETETSFDDYTHIFCHQVTVPFLEVFLKETKIPQDKLLVTVPKIGNIASATMPTQLAMAFESGRVAKGDRVLFAGLGGGLSVGVLLAQL